MERPLQGSSRSYLLGYGCCVVLTLLAFCFAFFAWGGKMVWIPLLGAAQLVVQLLSFFALHKEAKPHWNRTFFFFTFLIVAIIVLGTIWIMANLDYRM